MVQSWTLRKADVNRITAAEMVNERCSRLDMLQNEDTRMNLRCLHYFKMLGNIIIDGGNMFFACERALHQRPHTFVLYRVVMMYKSTENGGLIFNST